MKAKPHATPNTYLCNNHGSELQTVFQVDVSVDVPDVHPSRFCKACYSIKSLAIKKRQDGKVYSTAADRVFRWTAHDTEHEHCQVNSLM